MGKTMVESKTKKHLVPPNTQDQGRSSLPFLQTQKVAKLSVKK